MLEQRIDTLASSLQSRERPATSENSEQLEGALRALSDRIDRMPFTNDNASASAFAHLEQRVSYLLERLEASTDHRAGNLGRVEDGLQHILRHLEAQHASVAALTESRGSSQAPRGFRRCRDSSSANCPISVSARPNATVKPRSRSRPCTTRSAMSSIGWR